MVTVPSTGLPWWDPGCETPTVYVEGISGSGGEFGEACGSLLGALWAKSLKHGSYKSPVWT